MVEEVVQDPVEVPQEDGIVADAENNGVEQLLKSVNCPHKNRKGLFKAAALRKKLKANLKKRLTINYCDDCARLNPPEQRQSVWICVTCSYFGCDEKNHTLNHFEAQRSGTEHPLFFAERSGKFRCFRCDKEFAASEEGNGSMKTFSSDYNSFLKTKLKSDLAPGPAQSVKGGSASESSSLVAEEFDIPKNSQKRDEELLVQSSTMKNTEGKTLVPVKGLRNLGNTCFFNAIMQCLLQTHALALYIDLVGREDTIELMPSKVMVDGKQVQVPHVSLPLDSFDGPLNSIFASFLRDFRAGRPVQPNSLFKEICRLAPRFRGWAQQDSHELLHHLLDGLKTEEMARHKRAIDRYVGALENSDSRLTKAELNLLAKGMLKACGRPLIDAVFGGSLLQMVKCSRCGYISKTYEDFLDFSLSLPSTSSKSLFNGTPKMQKSASSNLTKQQKKLEKEYARKERRRRRSHEIISQKDDENNHDDDINDNNVDPKKLDGNICHDMNKLNMSTDDGECLEVLDVGETVSDESRALESCLRSFIAAENLSAANAYRCPKCCVPRNKQLCNGTEEKTVDAEKSYFIYEPPPVLMLHLKRFEQTHSMGGRVLVHKHFGRISFPRFLNIAPFCTKIAKRIGKDQKKVYYSLYGVVSHSGDLSSGHYVAYVHNRSPSSQTEKFFYEAANLPLPDSFVPSSTTDLKEIIEEASTGEWYYTSDSRVSSATESSVLNAEGYILFYERIY